MIKASIRIEVHIKLIKDYEKINDELTEMEDKNNDDIDEDIYYYSNANLNLVVLTANSLVHENDKKIIKELRTMNDFNNVLYYLISIINYR